MGTHFTTCIAAIQAGAQPTVDELRVALTELAQEYRGTREVASNLSQWMKALTAAHAENDDVAVHNILATYIKGLTPSGMVH